MFEKIKAVAAHPGTRVAVVVVTNVAIIAATYVIAKKLDSQIPAED